MLRALSLSLVRRSSHGSEAGVALIEFALVLPVLLMLLLGMIDFGKAFNYWIDETHLANVGARYAAVNKDPSTSSSLQEWLRSLGNTSELRDGGTPSMPQGTQISICFPNGTANVGDPVRVTLRSDYHWLKILGMPTTSTITGSATMRLEAQPTNYAAAAC